MRLFRKHGFSKSVWGRRVGEIDPDEIFLDSTNLPQFDVSQFEGRLEQPISKRTIAILGSLFVICALLFMARLWFLQINKGEAFAIRSEQNHLRETDIFSNRGVVFDRNGVILASNAKNEETPDFGIRVYAPLKGVAHILGYVKYPTKDSSGFYFRNSFLGEDGVEKVYHDILSGQNGVRIVETDALGKIQSQSTTRQPKDGKNVNLTIDSRLNNELYKIMAATSAEFGFKGGAGVIMDVRSGDILSLVSFPEFDPNVVTEGKSSALKEYQNSDQTPFLNRVVSGLYTPGSVVKPLLAAAALEEKLIDPQKQILAAGSISLPNPYFPDKKSVFNDWKVHGWVDMRKAIAVSSDVYFYVIGGGFEGQKGLGIANIEKYFRMFGIGEKTGIDLPNEKSGTIPNPEWKKQKFDGDIWRVGDTYNTSIGQYGVQVTPMEMVRSIAAIANNGILLTPTLIHRDTGPVEKELPLQKQNLEVAREGMRQAVTEGTSVGLNMRAVDVAAKTGTAELGSLKQYVNSWSVGFFPYNNPKYAFALIMERGPRANTVGATYVMRQLFDYMALNTQEYFSAD